MQYWMNMELVKLMHLNSQSISSRPTKILILHSLLHAFRLIMKKMRGKLIRGTKRENHGLECKIAEVIRSKDIEETDRLVSVYAVYMGGAGEEKEREMFFNE